MNTPAPVHTRVLLVEDDPELAQLTVAYLERKGFRVDWLADGTMLHARILNAPPDVVILDVGLPGVNGFELCHRIRPDFRGPIVMLTALGDEDNEITGLEKGADDYLAKPVSLRKLAIRLEAVLRRNRHQAIEAVYEDDELVVDPNRREIRVRGAVVYVSSTEFELAQLFVEHVGQPLSRETYFQRVTGAPYDGIDRALDVRTSQLRRKLVEAGMREGRISTVRGVGYQLNRQ